MKKFLSIFTSNWLIKLIIAFALGSLFLFLYNKFDKPILGYLTLIFYGYLVLFAIVGMIYAFVINPWNMIFHDEHTIHVKPNKHYPRNIFNKGIFPILFFKNNFEVKRDYKFSNKSSFIFPGDDKLDWSKIIGFSFGHHQKNESYRFGFRFKTENTIEVCEYKYVDGKRITSNIPVILELGWYYRFIVTYNKKEKTLIYEIRGLNGNYETYDVYKNTIKVVNPKLWGYTLGLYIGGNLTSDKQLSFLTKNNNDI